MKLTIQSSPVPSLPGQNVKINVFVEPILGIAEPTGTIQLAEDLNDLGTFTIKLGQVSASYTFNTAGAHILDAIYSGDFNYCPAVTRFGQQVDRITPTVTLAASAPSLSAGTPVTLTAQVGPAQPAGVPGPSGPVQFFEGTTLLGAAPLSSGKASLTLSTLEAGTHQIVATLVGDPNWFSVRSAAVTLTVNRAATTTVLTATSTSTRVNFTVRVVAGSIEVSSGSVQLTNAATNAILGSAPLPGANFSAPISQIAGQPITAVYAGSASFAPSASDALGIPGILNAAGAPQADFAPDEIVSLFGFNLGKSATPLTAAPPLPLDLGGTSVTVTDSAGVARQSGLYLAALTQINFVIPAATAPGAATITVAGAPAIPIHVNIAAVAAGLFTSGAQLVRVRPDGSQTLDTVTPNTPIVMGSDAVYLVLYGTGIRNRSSLAAVTCAIGSLNLPVVYAGPQPQFPGLDQVDVLLPASLTGAGQVNVTITADGQQSNVMSLKFQ